jgi:hypothetical protein
MLPLRYGPAVNSSIASSGLIVSSIAPRVK